MRTRRRAILVTTSGLVGLALVAFIFKSQRPRATMPVLAASASVQAFQFDPDTLVGWGEGPAQPILFSHRRHAGAFEISCFYCHTNVDRSPIAPMPSLATCFGCHQVVKAPSPEIQRLRGYRERGEAVPWVRVYKLPDFVQFNHSRHVRADVACEECHGPVDTFDVIRLNQPLTMGWCLGCHRQAADEQKLAAAEAIAAEYGASGRESQGLYPRSIDSDYGVTRGPIDCAACHY